MTLVYVLSFAKVKYKTKRNHRSSWYLKKPVSQLRALEPRLASFVKSIASPFAFYQKLAVTLAKKCRRVKQYIF
ncbi:MAG: hypothetical protein O7D30_06450, partial [Rickettsia endosymbiont of Ixodes persulcatus]|nr:hypothetical protein [Rickettsia endosymbiont of Ixodes persulcatus]